MRGPFLSFAVALFMFASIGAPAGAAGPPGVEVTIRSMRYDPVTLVAAQGTTVTWTNVTSPSRAHDVVSSLPGYIRSPLMVDGQSFRFTFRAAGTFTYVCSIHDVMIGSVEVPLRVRLVTSGHVPYFLVTLGAKFLPATSRYRYVLNWQMPGETDWQVKASRDNTLVVLATRPGAYRFRARLKDKVGGSRSANTEVVERIYGP